MLLSAGLLAAAVATRRIVPALPPSLVVLALGLLIAALVDLEDHGIAVVGEVAGGLPSFGLPGVGASDFLDLVLPAAAFSLVAFADLIATVRTFAQKHGYEVDANRELTAIGGANLVGGLTGAFPVSSSNSRSAVNDSAGARSQAAVVVAAAVVGLFLLFAMPLIEPLPTAALGVIIVVAAAGLINIRSIWRLRHVRSAEVALALVAFGGVLVFGVVGGVVVAIALSVGVFLYRAARPHDAVLGRIEDIDGYHDVTRWEGAETVPGLLVYRFDAAPFFVNAAYLRERVLELVDASEDVRWLVLNAEAWTYLDATAIDVLARLQVELEERGVALCFARLKGRQREIFEETGLTAQIGPDRLFPTVRAAVAAFESRRGGLNDGICVPLLLIAIAIAEAEESVIGHGEAFRLVLEEIGYGCVGGIVAGLAAAVVIRVGVPRRLVDSTWLQVVPVAGAALAYGLAVWMGGSGFIAAFVGGAVFGALRREVGGEVTLFLEETGGVLGAATFILFGAVMLVPVLDDLSAEVVLYALLSLTVVRMLPVPTHPGDTR